MRGRRGVDRADVMFVIGEAEASPKDMMTLPAACPREVEGRNFRSERADRPVVSPSLLIMHQPGKEFAPEHNFLTTSSQTLLSR